MFTPFVVIERPRLSPGQLGGYMSRAAIAPMLPIDIDRAVSPTILNYHDPELGLAKWTYNSFADYSEGLIGVPLVGQTLWFGQREDGECVTGEGDVYQVSLVWQDERTPAFYEVPIELCFDFQTGVGEVLGDQVTKNLYLKV